MTPFQKTVIDLRYGISIWNAMQISYLSTKSGKYQFLGREKNSTTIWPTTDQRLKAYITPQVKTRFSARVVWWQLEKSKH